MREDIAERVTDGRSDEDDRNGRGKVKRAHDKRQTDHVRPKIEVDNRLRPSERDENGPDKMHEAEELSEREPGLEGIKVIHNDLLFS